MASSPSLLPSVVVLFFIVWKRKQLALILPTATALPKACMEAAGRRGSDTFLPRQRRAGAIHGLPRQQRGVRAVSVCLSLGPAPVFPQSRAPERLRLFPSRRVSSLPPKSKNRGIRGAAFICAVGGHGPGCGCGAGREVGEILLRSVSPRAAAARFRFLPEPVQMGSLKCLLSWPGAGFPCGIWSPALRS